MHTENSWNPEGFRVAFAALSTAYGYARDDTARRANVHRSQVSRWARGHTQPSYEALDSLLAAAYADDATRPGLLADTARAAGYDRLAALYADRAPATAPVGEETAGGGRFADEIRTVDSEVGELYVDIVRDLHATTDSVSEDEAEAMRRRVIDRLRMQAEVALADERTLLEDRRRRREQGGDDSQ